MPLMAMGLQRRQDITMIEFSQKTAIKRGEGCQCLLSREEEWRKILAAKRKTDDPVILKERAQIRARFVQVDGPMRKPPVSVSAAKEVSPASNSSSSSSLSSTYQRRLGQLYSSASSSNSNAISLYPSTARPAPSSIPPSSNASTSPRSTASNPSRPVVLT
jgi:hypothetical protein